MKLGLLRGKGGAAYLLRGGGGGRASETCRSLGIEKVGLGNRRAKGGWGVLRVLAAAQMASPRRKRIRVFARQERLPCTQLRPPPV
jgi:hypothetical protein